MCYFDQTRWACGYWRWGHFRQQCNKEYRMGETCGLKLVYETRTERDVCKLCHDTEKKQRRYDKMYRDVQRWQRERNRNATIERTCAEMQEVLGQIYRMREEHDHRLQSLGQKHAVGASEQANPILQRNVGYGDTWMSASAFQSPKLLPTHCYFCKNWPPLASMPIVRWITTPRVDWERVRNGSHLMGRAWWPLRKAMVQQPSHNVRDLVHGLGLDTWLIAWCVAPVLYPCGPVMLFSKDAEFPHILVP
ncbi:hypothetical protein FOQG_15004 [Fusarium oxysporum f. sp. raphani 54005]|uniref:Uncharacterized protein n=1 Tax=Fusarium oxysporum f. sp. raphani 54005 TaxID=1089458 RepID=X0BF71_FUSOX|nr:hypothetical protein FOQG_15004 [Fusarium oxysporum f. sp. raphani 54005]